MCMCTLISTVQSVIIPFIYIIMHTNCKLSLLLDIHIIMSYVLKLYAKQIEL